MSEKTLPPLFTWLTEPMEPHVKMVIDRVRRADDVRHVAVMPDVHLAGDVTVGTVLATDRLLYPQAVGGDIGCGMLAVAFDATADVLANPSVAGRLLSALAEGVPTLRRHRRSVIAFPTTLTAIKLSHSSLEAIAREEGQLQLGTLGGGNHFVELQLDDNGRLWLMIHSGSRAMGQAIRGHHLANAAPAGSQLRALDASQPTGLAYANDVAWARAYATANRQAIADVVTEAIERHVGSRADWSSVIAVDHNHVAREQFGDGWFWVHRKGAMPAIAGSAGVVPGSMGTTSYHVEGLGCTESLCSSAHGAGRAMSRESARRSVPQREFHRQMAGVWYDYRQTATLREESPSAYKDIRAVMRAQRELVKITRHLRPLLNFKGS